MRLLALFLASLIIALQWPLWIGKGSWLNVWQLDSELAVHRTKNASLQERNDALAAEVHDLKAGTDAIEERARNELGMIRNDEVFFQVLDHTPLAASVPTVSAASSANAFH